MPQFSPEAVARFEEAMKRDPTSQVFAPLAEAYRAEGRLSEAHRVVSDGVRRHPQFPGGWVTLGKISRELKQPREAMEAFQRALQCAPENLLALQLLAECYLELKQAKEALKLFKRVLFLNPQAEKARRIVAKLESLTADEFDDDLFAMTKLSTLVPEPEPVAEPSQKSVAQSKSILRLLSLADAFIVRNDISRATQLLGEAQIEFGPLPEIQQRQLILQRRQASQLSSRVEHAQTLAPVPSREEGVRQRKIGLLRAVLQRIEALP